MHFQGSVKAISSRKLRLAVLLSLCLLEGTPNTACNQVSKYTDVLFHGLHGALEPIKKGLPIRCRLRGQAAFSKTAISHLHNYQIGCELTET